MDREHIISKMEMYIRVNGKIINLTVKENILNMISKLIKVSFKMEKRMALAYIIFQTGLYMKANGKTI